MALVNPLVFKDNAHRPLNPATDQLAPSSIAISPAAGNLLRAGAEGLYIGTQFISPVVYVSAAGVDDLLHGTKAAPFKTLDYAVTQVLNFNLATSGAIATIALKAGETFALTGRYAIPATGSLTLAFYGDATFGDFNSAAVNGTLIPAAMAGVVRPIINQVITSLNGKYISNGFDNGTLRLEGIQLNLAAVPAGSPPPESYGMMDFHFASNTPESCLDLVGSIINRTDQNSVGGVYGVGGRGNGFVRQYASQFRIQGALATSTAGMSAVQLASRNHFIHMYRDLASNDTRAYTYSVFPSSATSNNGSGLTKLSWSDVTATTLPQGATLASFPVLADPQFGFRNYVTGIVRDQQSRPLNILSSRLF